MVSLVGIDPATQLSRPSYVGHVRPDCGLGSADFKFLFPLPCSAPALLSRPFSRLFFLAWGGSCCLVRSSVRDRFAACMVRLGASGRGHIWCPEISRRRVDPRVVQIEGTGVGLVVV